MEKLYCVRITSILGLPASGDAGTEAAQTVDGTGVDGGACTQRLAASVYGDHWTASSALAPPAGVDTLHAVVYLDGAPIPRACWSIDSTGNIRVNPSVFPDAGLHSISFTFECAVTLPQDTAGVCAAHGA